MKKIVLTTLGIATLGMASYAARYMQVLTSDGKIVKFDVEEVTEVNFMEDETTPSDTIPASAHAYVDLGLPSGTLWATYNIGATKPEEYGDYFAWGETEPKEVYDWSTYKWGDGFVMRKYNSNNGLKILLDEDDAAVVNWGTEWRMPTTTEQQELIENCQFSWTEVNGVYGAKFTAENGNSVFFPASGNRYKSDVSGVDTVGSYWSSSTGGRFEDFSHLLDFNKEGAYRSYIGNYLGFPVRAVRAKKVENIDLPTDTTAVIIPADTIAKDTSVVVLPSDTTNIDTISSNHAYVDLGLPSGTLWATYNIGATKPEEYGDYFAWGEIESKEVYYWSSYKWIDGEENMPKYNSEDGLKTLLATDDAATANWGAEWRMPTNEEQQELIENCQFSWTEINGVYGAKFTAENGKSVFLPAAGDRYGSVFDRVSRYGYYWSSSLQSESSASSLCFLEDDVYWGRNDRRNYGLTVRAVRAKK